MISIVDNHLVGWRLAESKYTEVLWGTLACTTLATPLLPRNFKGVGSSRHWTGLRNMLQIMGNSQWKGRPGGVGYGTMEY